MVAQRAKTRIRAVKMRNLKTEKVKAKAVGTEMESVLVEAAEKKMVTEKDIRVENKRRT